MTVAVVAGIVVGFAAVVIATFVGVISVVNTRNYRSKSSNLVNTSIEEVVSHIWERIFALAGV